MATNQHFKRERDVSGIPTATDLSLNNANNVKNNGITSTASSNQSGSNDFVKKLFQMLQEDGYKDVVRWTTNGDSFVVLNTNEFTKEILPMHFKHSNFASFVRQLNKYDFHKVKISNEEKPNYQYGEDAWEFKHPDFRYNDRESLENIKRKGPSSKKNPTQQSAPHPLVSGAPGSTPSIYLPSDPHFTQLQSQTQSQLQYLKESLTAVETENKSLRQDISVLNTKYKTLIENIVAIKSFDERYYRSMGILVHSLMQAGIKLPPLDFPNPNLLSLQGSPQVNNPQSHLTNNLGHHQSPPQHQHQIQQSPASTSQPHSHSNSLSHLPPPHLLNSPNSAFIQQQQQPPQPGQPQQPLHHQPFIPGQPHPVGHHAHSLSHSLSHGRPTPPSNGNMSPAPISPQNIVNSSQTSPIAPPSNVGMGSINAPTSVATQQQHQHQRQSSQHSPHQPHLPSNPTVTGNNSNPTTAAPTSQQQPPQQQSSQPTQQPGSGSSNPASDPSTTQLTSTDLPQVSTTNLPNPKFHVLLVEDDNVCIQLCRKFLVKYGCQVTVVTDGLNAISTVEHTKYDLVLMDIVMPNLDGATATSVIRSFDTRTPIIAMTGNIEDNDLVTYLQNGMSDILAKPFTKDDLYSILSKHLLTGANDPANANPSSTAGGSAAVTGTGNGGAPTGPSTGASGPATGPPTGVTPTSGTPNGSISGSINNGGVRPVVDASSTSSVATAAAAAAAATAVNATPGNSTPGPGGSTLLSGSDGGAGLNGTLTARGSEIDLSALQGPPQQTLILPHEHGTNGGPAGLNEPRMKKQRLQ